MVSVISFFAVFTCSAEPEIVIFVESFAMVMSAPLVRVMYFTVDPCFPTTKPTSSASISTSSVVMFACCLSNLSAVFLTASSAASNLLFDALGHDVDAIRAVGKALAPQIKKCIQLDGEMQDDLCCPECGGLRARGRAL